ncbi:uncharacterized protein LOC112465435 isoform X2 [Temnothorax curvispinosus]|uniref:Uncharacterized protein LOC112465435 isoform X2 n=1 Tax=Temnothorax curvispinosus TaxID=300111 RepID=A0A6J1R3N4_9HYME|nr:uncharacterized protein LOC112465435 isoform X2 [Temnothorax curvispinosus]
MCLMDALFKRKEKRYACILMRFFYFQSGNDSPVTVPKTTEHENKVHFAREFADVGSVTENLCLAPESCLSSVSRLLTELRDRTRQSKLQAAFNDVHEKYERLKKIVSIYESEKTVLKKNIHEKGETIKTLETRYDKLEKANLELDGIRKRDEEEILKRHAMIRRAKLKNNLLAKLVKQEREEKKALAEMADLELDGIRMQNEAEIQKLHAMIKKANVKSNLTAELLENKTKICNEFKEILDGIIARIENDDDFE